MKRTLLALLCGAVVGSAPLAAHHSFAADYFEDQIVKIEGQLRELQYKNPHSILLISVKDDHGSLQTFTAEWNGVNRLARSGITKDTFRPGDHLIISGSPGRRAEERRLHVKGIERPTDGSVWGRRGPARSSR